MADSTEIKAILERFRKRDVTEADQRALKDAIESGSISVSTPGSRTVAIGGNVERATILAGDGNVILSVSGSDAAFILQALGDSRTSKRKERTIPPSLPYLCNRTVQENELTLALDTYPGEKEGRAMVFIIHGEESECTDAFVERLRDDYIPQKLNASNIESHVLQWPKTKKDVPDPISSARSQLAAYVRSIFNEIKDRNAPVLISTHISTDWCDPHGARLIDTYLRFWDTYQERKSGRLVINCLCITYLQGERWNLLSRRRLNKINRKIKLLVGDKGLTAYKNIYVAALTELPAVDVDDAANWARLKPVRTLWESDVEELIARIKGLYRRRFIFKARPIPMKKLAPKLRAILTTQT